VTFNTQLLVANQTRQQTVALAHGSAAQRAQQAEAIVEVTTETINAEMIAFGNLSQNVGLGGNESLSYMWWNSNEEIVGKEFRVGLDPQSMIRT
jgi:hypothetical protein